MPCKSCLDAAQKGGEVVYEMATFHPELLPPLPKDITDWSQIGELLILLAGNIRQDLQQGS